MTETPETRADEPDVPDHIREQVYRAIQEVGPDALAKLIPAAQAGAVWDSLRKLMREVSWVGKTGHMSGKGGNYDFREIEQVISALGWAAREFGLMLSARVLAGPVYSETTTANGTHWTSCQGLVIEYRWRSTIDGSESGPMVGVGEGRDTADKATNKAMQAALKYAVTQGTVLPSLEPDPDSERPEIEDAPARGSGGADPNDDAGDNDPTPGDVLASVRQAKDMDRLTSIYRWLEERGLLVEEIEGQTFEAHLEAARRVIEGSEGGYGQSVPDGSGPD